MAFISFLKSFSGFPCMYIDSEFYKIRRSKYYSLD